jgi:transposase
LCRLLIGSVPMSGHISSDKIIVVETRRRWSDEERQRALDDTMTASVSAVARKHGMAKSLLFRWRKEAGLTGKRRHVEGFVPVRIAAPPAISLPQLSAAASVTHEAGSIEIELVGGTKLRVSGTVRPESLRQVIAALTT